MSRQEQLMPAGVPRWIRVYDNGGRTADRYTVVFTGAYRRIGLKRHERPTMWHVVAGMSGEPYWPQGVCMHSEYPNIIDRPTSSHLGRRVKFDKLPVDVRYAIIQTYVDLWNLELSYTLQQYRSANNA